LDVIANISDMGANISNIDADVSDVVAHGFLHRFQAGYGVQDWIVAHVSVLTSSSRLRRI